MWPLDGWQLRHATPSLKSAQVCAPFLIRNADLAIEDFDGGGHLPAGASSGNTSVRSMQCAARYLVQPKRQELETLITAVTSQLLAAQNANDPTAIMKFSECELELAVDWEVAAEGSTKLWVIDAKGSIKRTESNTIHVKFQALPNVPLVYLAKALRMTPPIQDAAPTPAVPGTNVARGTVIRDQSGSGGGKPA